MYNQPIKYIEGYNYRGYWVEVYETNVGIVYRYAKTHQGMTMPNTTETAKYSFTSPESIIDSLLENDK